MNQSEHFNMQSETNFQVVEHEILKQIIQAWTQLKTLQPLVHCITNQVAANYVANILLAAGASPAMIDNPFEAESFVKISSALSINLGTPNTEQVEAIKIACQTADLHQIPWVLDPVGYGAILKWRSQITDELLAFKPTIIRGNASEISTLAGNQVQSKGVDTSLNSADVYDSAICLLNHTDCIAISGESDYIISQELKAVIQVNGGSHLQPKVTATGCALGALIAAYASVSSPSFAAIAAHVHFAIAGKLAYKKANAVGSFNVAFLDEVFNMTDEKFQQFAEISVIKRL